MNLVERIGGCCRGWKRQELLEGESGPLQVRRCPGFEIGSLILEDLLISRACLLIFNGGFSYGQVVQVRNRHKVSSNIHS